MMASQVPSIEIRSIITRASVPFLLDTLCLGRSYITLPTVRESVVKVIGLCHPLKQIWVAPHFVLMESEDSWHLDLVLTVVESAKSIN